MGTLPNLLDSILEASPLLGLCCCVAHVGEVLLLCVCQGTRQHTLARRRRSKSRLQQAMCRNYISGIGKPWSSQAGKAA
eukprot:1074319-Pelagomonas_calceolata.AAC.1